MQLSLLTVKVKELDFLFIWTPGWENWQPLKDFLSSDQKFFTGVNSNKQVESIDIKTVPNFEITLVNKVAKPTEETKTDIKIIEKDESKPMENSNSNFVKPKNKADIGTLKNFREKLSSKEKVVPSSQPEISKKEFTELVDPADFNSDGKNDDYFKPDVDGDDMLRDGIQVDKSQSHFDFELRPHERTYFKRAERHAFKIEVIIALSTGKSLRSFSRNISLTGTLIEDNIPEEFHNKTVEVLIHNQLDKTNKNSKLALQGKVVGQGGTTRRLTFSNMNEKNLDKMEALLAAYFEKQNELLKKKAG